MPPPGSAVGGRSFASSLPRLEQPMSTNDEQAKLWDLIKNIRFGMLTHRHSDGQLHSHPLTTQNQKLDEGATLYFFVPKDGDIARHVATDPTVNLTYADTDEDSYVSISGQA